MNIIFKIEKDGTKVIVLLFSLVEKRMKKYSYSANADNYVNILKYSLIKREQK